VALGPFIILIALVALLLETLVVYKAIQNTSRARLLRRLPWSRLGQVQSGLVKVQGRIYALAGLLRSPLTDSECIYFRFKVQEKRHHAAGPHGGGGSYWKTLINDAQAVPCALEDDTGSAEVRLKSAELLLRPGATERSGFLNKARPELEATLKKRYGYSSVGLIFNHSLYYSETRIDDGDTLVALGTARQVPGGHWELVRGLGPFIASNKGLAGVVASYRDAAMLWWLLAAVLPVVAVVAILAVRNVR
jgi:hypothetical protein